MNEQGSGEWAHSASVALFDRDVREHARQAARHVLVHGGVVKVVSGLTGMM